MSCGSENFTSNCVCDTLLAIVDAQDKVNPSSGCDNSCETAIQQLVNGSTNGVYDTIPVILYCKGTCEPFVGYSLEVENRGRDDASYGTLCGCLFRVVDVDPETCCATLEIINGTGADCDTQGPSCIAQLNGARLSTVGLTGHCITVDLHCFCAVTCIAPQRLLV